jgi:hypothetical protein
MKVPCTCLVCGSGFLKTEPQIRRGAGKYCSRHCQGVARSANAVRSPYIGRYIAQHVVRDHRLIAERVLGRPLPSRAEVHHVDGNGRNNANGNLVICPNRSYHMLLHARARVLRMGGDPNTQRFCGTCKRLNPISEFYVRKTGPALGTPVATCRSCVRSLSYERRTHR